MRNMVCGYILRECSGQNAWVYEDLFWLYMARDELASIATIITAWTLTVIPDSAGMVWVIVSRPVLHLPV